MNPARILMLLTIVGVVLAVFGARNATRGPTYSNKGTKMYGKSKIEMEFHSWLDTALNRRLPSEIAAFNFNIYEGSDPTYHIQLIGASRYRKDDPDWACYDIFTTGENLFFLPRSLAGNYGHEFSVNLVRDYLKSGKFRNVLLSKEAVGVGFVNGDIELAWEKSKE